jgi:hypothetical protein
MKFSSRRSLAVATYLTKILTGLKKLDGISARKFSEVRDLCFQYPS